MPRGTPKPKFTDLTDLPNADAVEKANAPAAAKPKSTSDMVEITITKLGDGKVSTGEHVAGEGDIYASRGEKLMVSPGVVASLEARGFAESD